MSHSQTSKNDLIQLAALLFNHADERSSTQGDLLAKLNFHGITLLAAERADFPEHISDQLARHKAMMVANDALKQIELTRLFKAFAEADLAAMLFKGSALAYSLYRKPWLRPRSDNDIFVSPSDRGEFDQLFAKLGYQKLFAIEGKYVSYQSTYGKALVGGSVINIDLHWHINNRQMFSDTYTLSELIHRGQTLETIHNTKLEPSIIIPSLVDSLLIASIHRSGHHNKEERLIWLYDIHLLANSLNQDQWTQLCHRAHDKRVSGITLNALETCQDIFGTQLSSRALEQLRNSCSANEPSAVFLDQSLSERHYFWADLKSMSTLTAQLGFIRETLFPPPSYVRQQMNTSSTGIAYLKRLFRGAKRTL